MALSKHIPIEEIKKVLSYDKETGMFTWIVNMNGKDKTCSIGSFAGTKMNTGYVQICVRNVRYCAHRLAWAYEYGSIDQDLVIDHINRVRNDNRLENLRLVSGLENRRNLSVQKRSASGHSGIVWSKSKQKWQVSICINGTRFSCGNFANFENAKSARNDALLRSSHKLDYGYWVAS